MGIGNRTTHRGRRPHPGLITPHGGRHIAAAVRTQVSLPLMGIGNHTRPRLARPQRNLITPHGDRKRVTVKRSPRTVEYSLPLMGIGNASLRLNWQREAETHYPSWGSETSSPPRLICLTQCLITPHGDRKPGARSSRTTTSTTHYPSWGSETRRDGIRPAAADSPHYPSWGSETASHGDYRGGLRPPHYPSWGSETTDIKHSPDPNSRKSVRKCSYKG